MGNFFENKAQNCADDRCAADTQSRKKHHFHTEYSQ